MSNVSSFVKRIRDIMRNDSGINGDAQRIEQLVWMLFLKVYAEKEEDWKIDDPKYESIVPTEYQWKNWAKDNGDGKALTAEELLDFINNRLFPSLRNL